MSEFGRAHNEQNETVEIDGKTISFETGWVAKQADGAIVARQGDTMVLATVCSGAPRPGQNFFPMTCEYQEKQYAAGKIPGGFFKREGRPGEHEILCCRLMDRPIRPMFPDGYMEEVQIICTVISADGINSPDMLAISAASAALTISQLPFMGPIAAVRVGRIDGKLIANGSPEEFQKSDINLVVAGTSEAIVMVEGGADIVPEAEILDALNFGHENIKKIIVAQESLQKKCGKEKVEFVSPVLDADLTKRVDDIVGDRLDSALSIKVKHERSDAVSVIKAEVNELLEAELGEAFEEKASEIGEILYQKTKYIVRNQILDTSNRIDGRDLTTVRPIECQVDLLPRAHGSALFTRGETQGIVATTLGTNMDSQRLDTLDGESERTFMLHYNFPPFCTGEAKMLRGTARREVGHGALAHRALTPLVPSQDDFPYVIRVVSDVTESNGSSSMATVCGGSMSMMAAGVPMKSAVGGVAMGLIKDGDRVAVLTDILGDEDHYGDMDFKVCGTTDGITALQMDIKCTGLSRETMESALGQAREARVHILSEMNKAISESRGQLSDYAPQIITIKINPDKIRDIIGPGGKTIRSIVETTGVKIDIEDDGTVKLASSDKPSIQRAIDIISGLTEEAEIGKIYCGVVKKIVDFGAFVEILPGTEGLLHISQIAEERVENVSDYMSEGDEVNVRVLDIDRSGKIRLSKKEAEEK